MKTNLHTILMFIFLAAALTLNSCGGFFGIDITDQSSIDSNLRSKIGEIITNDPGIIEISFSLSDGSTFSKTITGASVHYFEPETDNVKCKWITLSGKTEGKDKRVSHEYDGTMKFNKNYAVITPSDVKKLSEVDFSQMASYVNKAGKMVEESENEFSGIGNYTIKPNVNPEKNIHTFTVESRQGAETTTKSGRLATKISYLTFNFKTDPSGDVIMVE